MENKKKLSRRDFLTGAAVGTVAVASSGLLASCATEGNGATSGGSAAHASDIQWD